MKHTTYIVTLISKTSISHHFRIFLKRSCITSCMDMTIKMNISIISIYPMGNRIMTKNNMFLIIFNYIVIFNPLKMFFIIQINTVVIASNEKFYSIELRHYLIYITIIPKHIAENINQIILCNHLVPIMYYCFVHIFKSKEWAIIKS